MKRLLAVAVAIVALGLAVPALAATKSKATATAETCQSYAQQLDQAMSSHAGAPKLGLAKKLKGDGDAACSAGKFGAGVKKYRLGLKDLGMKPVRK
jgi:hypothetical protein